MVDEGEGVEGEWLALILDIHVLVVLGAIFETTS